MCSCGPGRRSARERPPRDPPIGGRSGSQTELLEQMIGEQGPDAGIELIGAR